MATTTATTPTYATTSTAETAATAAAMKKSLGMNKDDFMKLFVAQLKYQDPLKPQDPTAMLDQLSQLTMVEQSYNSNTALGNILTAQNNASNLSSVSFIGKDVKANGSEISFDGSTAATLQFNQTVATASNDVVIKDASGSIVRTLSAGSQKAGDATVSWDGRNNGGVLMPAGSYSFSVKGTTSTGSEVAASTYITGKINGIDFANGTPVLTVGSITIPFSSVVTVKGG